MATIDLSNRRKLQKKPWKVWMSAEPDPSAVLVKASDLLKGTRLGHNLFIYNENAYASGMFNGSFEQFYRYAIDLSPAKFDKRSKPKQIKINTSSLANFANISSLNFQAYDKDAALYPRDLNASFAVDSTWKNYFRENSLMTSEDVTSSFQVNEMFTVMTKSEDNTSSDIAVDESDEVFSATMVFEDGKKAYTKLYVQKTLKIYKFLLGALLYNCVSDGSVTDILSAFKASYANLNAEGFSTILSFFENCDIGNGKKINLFDYIYIWVKAPFCGDYIDPVDFNQNLNQDADVVHRNLLIANNYDSIRNNFDRYDESMSYDVDHSSEALDDDFKEKLTRPYCPMTAPLKDLLSDKLMTLSGISGDFSKKITGLLNDSDTNDDSFIGSVLVTPEYIKNNVGSNDEKFVRLTPFTYYDPESRDKADYYEQLGKIPTLIGRDGNITTDGRILSPTVDELWYIIYKLILGVNKDSTTYIASPVGDDYGDVDSSLTEATNQFTWTSDSGTITGSPINFSFKKDSETGVINGITVDEWVANPNGFSINVHSFAKNISDKVNKYYSEYYNDDSRNIYNTIEQIAFGNEDVHQKAGLTGINQEYGPRSVPLSLRELEAAIMGVKYNVDNNSAFNYKTYAITGKYGVIKKDDNGVIISGGSLFQMHRDYNADFENPNTYFKMGAKSNEDDGRDAIFGDLNGVEEVHSNGTPLYMLDNNHKRIVLSNGSLKKKTSGMPLLASNYGKSETLAKEQGEYDGADVYMAADGTWRYRAEHTRIPILRSRY